MNTMQMLKLTVLACGAAGAVLLAPAHQAGAGGMLELEMDTVPTIIGVAVGALPDYRGSDDYTFGFAPMIRYTFSGQERYIQLMANELTINVFDDKMFRFGPLANYHFGRTDSVDDPMVSKMHEIDDTVELGAFADIVWTLSDDPRHRFILGAKLYQDVGNESDGFRANVGFRYWLPVAKPVDLNLSAGFIYQSDDYANHYFGVNADNVGSSGLPFFNAGGGVNEYYMVVGGLFYLNKNWLMTVGVRGSVIAGDPADSPIVDQRGDATQWIGGIGIGYAFW
ncbi:MAG: MipA/OmpV family protein [Desulfobulbus sp.]|jgi:outer membrane protein|uniref:MipA/OmpV family protein n=1 Tax=Desulfobulbus sp. TaxID=895 RepID=UPI00284D714C|nr:MipA/OmpV family protein [Desulfobulbus sp.]MDR2549937.1 MipA/OmpV family protein [Desulfobulbus sp.]